MTILAQIQAFGTLSVFSFVWTEWTNTAKYMWRDDVKIPGRPPNWLFAPVWIILKLMIIATWLIWILDSTYPIAVELYVVLFINEILRKMWTVLAADYNLYKTSLVVAILISLTGLTNLILFIIYDAWLLFGLYCPYVLWTIYACYINAYYVYLDTAMVRNLIMMKLTPSRKQKGMMRK